eukprot:TRINITY_DN11791_c0_g1_i3.p1 TRINITY_DN11791_c0_g1~~TRINITY_DN11791_c0_g1_i3.p1  ORF type:complete len:101 (-),score=21.06 TRINITY_DN11791_c0_g1_i3:37-339(-)
MCIRDRVSTQSTGAIASSLKFLHPVSEEMGIQYYWSSLSAADCIRPRWDMIQSDGVHRCRHDHKLSLIHISEPTRLLSISYAVFCLKKKKNHKTKYKTKM